MERVGGAKKRGAKGGKEGWGGSRGVKIVERGGE